MLNLNKCAKTKPKRKSQHPSLRTAHVCACIIVHNCCTQHSKEQFW